VEVDFGTFISNLCSVHFPFVAIIFTSLAYEIFYARKVDLFDKIKEVIFSQLFPCVWNVVKFNLSPRAGTEPAG
jgi:hypothetical protein